MSFKKIKILAEIFCNKYGDESQQTKLIENPQQQATSPGGREQRDPSQPFMLTSPGLVNVPIQERESVTTIYSKVVDTIQKINNDYQDLNLMGYFSDRRNLQLKKQFGGKQRKDFYNKILGEIISLLPDIPASPFATAHKISKIISDNKDNIIENYADLIQFRNDYIYNVLNMPQSGELSKSLKTSKPKGVWRLLNLAYWIDYQSPLT